MVFPGNDVLRGRFVFSSDRFIYLKSYYYNMTAMTNVMADSRDLFLREGGVVK